MPTTLTRSLIVVIIPGLVALGPWALWFVLHVANFDDIYKCYATLINASLLGIAIILGSVIELSMSQLEVRWDKQREDEYKVTENWFHYLSLNLKAEPVGFRYISRMVTTLYFELAMMVASPLSLSGLALLVFLNFQSYPKLGAVAVIALALGAGLFFYWQARSTHEVLCETRMEINKRVDTSR